MTQRARLIAVCWILISAAAFAQTSSLRVDSKNSQKLSELTPPPDRYLPTVYLLQDPDVQAKLTIDNQQQQEIRSIAAGIRDPQLLEQMASSAPSFSEYSHVTDSQQRRQLEARSACQLHLSHRLENEVLSPSQLAKLNQLRVRLCGMVYFLNEQSTTDLSILPEQRSLILEQHTQIMRESNSLSATTRNELIHLTGEKRTEAQKALNRKIGELERNGVERVLQLLNEDQRTKYELIAGTPTELRRESLSMKIALLPHPEH